MTTMAWMTISVFAVTIGLVIANAFDATIAALLGVAAMVWIGVMTETDAFSLVDWNVMAILVSVWIIAGYFGKTGVPSWLSVLLGSETQKVLAHSKVPVLVHR